MNEEAGFGTGCASGLVFGFLIGFLIMIFFIWWVSNFQVGARCGPDHLSIKDGKAIATQTCTRELR